MKRCTKTAGKTGKTKLRKASHPKRKAVRAAVKNRPAPDTKLQEQLDLQTLELAEVLEQLTATSDVLQAISGSGGDLNRVFETVLSNATHLCKAKFGVLHLCEGENFRTVALHNAPKAYIAAKKRDPIIRGVETGNALDMVRKTLAPVQVADVLKERAYTDTSAQSRTSFVSTSGVRSLLAVPMLAGGSLIGVIIIYRQEVRPFTDKQIELVRNFAAQAVIAIENARLLNELRQRTDNLSEALEQQTATSDVLQVISNSPGELELVFQIMLENAVRICEANFGILWLREGDGFRSVALHNLPSAYAEQRQREPVIQAGAGTGLGRVARTKQVIHVADVRAERAYVERDPLRVSTVELGGYRTVLDVPMLKDEELVGVITIYRQEVRPFTDKQIELLRSFAAQAVIAIENTRLLSELRQRTDDLSDSLERQTATSEVLKIVSSSPGDLEPVFQAMLANATRICEAKFGTLFRFDGELFHRVAGIGTPPEFVEYQRQRGPFRPDNTGDTLGRMCQEMAVVHVIDEQQHPTLSPPAKYGGARSILAVPMLKDAQLVGAFVIYRQEVRPFAEKQIELVQNFAAQAVIAIENTRLLNELRLRTDELSQRTEDLTETLEQQTATSEVLRVISSSPGDLKPVFQEILDSATRICEANFGVLFDFDPQGAFPVAWRNVPTAFDSYLRNRERRNPQPGSDLDLLMKSKQVVHTEDMLVSHGSIPPTVLGGARTELCVPMLKDDELIGAVTIYRQEVRPFTDRQIDLVKSFAAQAVIAIENTRLLNELRELFAAANRHRGRTQGYQPLSVRFAIGIQYPSRVCGQSVRSRHDRDSSPEWRCLRTSRDTRALGGGREFYESAPVQGRTRQRSWTGGAGG